MYGNMLDLSIAIALAIVTILMGYFGVHVTIHPPVDDQSKRNYKVGFSLLAIAAVALIGIQTYRSQQGQSQLQIALGKIGAKVEVIKTDNDRPITVNVQLPAIQESSKSANLSKKGAPK